MDARGSKTEARTESPRKNDGKAVRVTTCDGRTKLVSAKKEQTLNPALRSPLRRAKKSVQRQTPKLRTYRKLGIEGGIAEIEGKAAR